ncbi:MAG: hypothetical protein A2X49_13190 [Lentisphaerae bacterium GWF2_52_8]|nr:MAG: hypothetical protein A2X49_13190 [Lentisphaerae bacterium GWF2_52_8]
MSLAEEQKNQTASTDLKLAPLFTENMVLQREIKIPVWGESAPNEEISIEFCGQEIKTKADSTGKWKTELLPLPPGGPFTLSVRSGGKKIVEFKNVLIGDVWICSGQSNMAMRVESAKDSVQEIAAANYPNIRLFRLSAEGAAEPKTELKNKKWEFCTPETVKSFSAAAYYFGRAIHKELNIPVGLVQTAVGGSAIHSWMPWSLLENSPDFVPAIDSFKEAMKSYPEKKDAYDKALADWKEKQKQLPKEEARKIPIPRPPLYYGQGGAPAALFNAMINPLVPYAIKGVIWYQGEADAGRAAIYRKLLPAMISEWRTRWGQGNFPFLIVQLPNWQKPPEKPSDSAWAELREAQAMALSLPATGLAVTIELGEADNIHPSNKQEVGKRLALLALNMVYGQKNICSGPRYKSMKTDGNKIRIEFDKIGSGLVAKDGELKQFAIAGEDKIFEWAEAKIEGHSVIVSSPTLEKPVAVRYAWADNPAGCNLYNKEGLPAAPFRTDTWPLTTENVRWTWK